MSAGAPRRFIASDHSEHALENPGRYMGSFVITAFGAFWLILWSFGRDGGAGLGLAPIVVVGVVLAAASIIRYVGARKSARLSTTPGDLRRIRLWFTLVVAVEMVGIYALGQMLARRDLTEWIAVAVILIVGLHFFPLARIFRYRGYTWTGSALVLIALGLPWLVADGPSSPWLPLATGAVLWMTAVHILSRREARPRE